MKFNIWISLKKGIIGFIYSLVAVVIMAVVKAMTDYQPVVCTKEIVENCTPQYIISAYYSIVPVITGSLIAFANWLKNRNNV